jgi:hypothetical protein
MFVSFLFIDVPAKSRLLVIGGVAARTAVYQAVLFLLRGPLLRRPISAHEKLFFVTFRSSFMISSK